MLSMNAWTVLLYGVWHFLRLSALFFNIQNPSFSTALHPVYSFSPLWSEGKTLSKQNGTILHVFHSVCTGVNDYRKNGAEQNLTRSLSLSVSGVLKWGDDRTNTSCYLAIFANVLNQAACEDDRCKSQAVLSSWSPHVMSSPRAIKVLLVAWIGAYDSCRGSTVINESHLSELFSCCSAGERKILCSFCCFSHYLSCYKPL